MSSPAAIDVFVCGPQLYAHNLSQLQIRDRSVVYGPLEGEALPDAEPIREVHYLPVGGGLTLLVTDEGLYLSAGRLDPATLQSDPQAVQP